MARAKVGAALAGAAAIGVALVLGAAGIASGGSREEPPAVVPGGAGKAGAAGVDYLRDIEPLIARACSDCHSGRVVKGRLHLDSIEGMLTGGRNGPAVVPGKSSESLLIHRVRGVGAEDGDDRMPLDQPALTEVEIAKLAAWIDAGAMGPACGGDGRPRHWAYRAPVRPEVPAVKTREWVRNPIDAFVLARLEAERVTPTSEADRATLIRRVTLDITGLPPTLREVDEFIQDRTPDAYEKVVDRLLASPAYGERWARVWLDLARYADSRGYEKDQKWSMWPWRDWVINALNADLPFDRFTIEQLAGDLLPNATQAQKIATGFHRNSMINEEGGVDPEEARFVTVVDRTNTTASVWLGATLACAQCHDHKYDPYTAKDYYAFAAFFNSTPAETRDQGNGESAVTSPTVTIPRAEEPGWKAEAEAIEKELAAAGIVATSSKADQTGAEPHPRSPATVELREKQKRMDELKKLLAEPVTTGVMQEMEKPRETRIAIRGNFMNPGDVVEPGVPEVLPGMTLSNGPRRANRLDLAEWIVSAENPLTARVTVNRIWAQYFGRGLVVTEEDFGTRGDKPAHPELLDWLACEFVARGWSQKALHRLIVTSATYRQGSAVSSVLLDRDPMNALLARGPRFRLDAEAIRDQALVIGGILVEKIGGPSVFPTQPPGIWGHAYSSETWTPSNGEEAHRRSLYTFWKRATPYPSFVTFDAPQRQVACTRRSRTNTPLQALVTLNDPVYMEAAAGLARRVTSGVGAKLDATGRVTLAFRVATARKPSENEGARLLKLFDEQRAIFKADPTKAKTLAGAASGGWRSAGVADDEFAAWIMVCNVLLNLDEVLTKE